MSVLTEPNTYQLAIALAFVSTCDSIDIVVPEKAEGLEGENQASAISEYEYQPIEPFTVWFDLGHEIAEGTAIAQNGKGWMRINWGEGQLSDVPMARVSVADPLQCQKPETQNSEHAVQPVVFPDIAWGSDNEWGIPVLDTHLQPTAEDVKFIKWGAAARDTRNTNGYHFYTDDYKFSGVWSNPEQLPRSGCAYAIEANFSTGKEIPKAEMLFDVYRKRCLSRFWQLRGVKIWVDVNVEPEIYQLNFLGVPKEWRYFATRYQRTLPDGTEAGLEYIRKDWEAICNYTGSQDCILLVYGGSKSSFEKLKNAGNFLWIPEHNDSIRGRFNNG